MMQEEKQGEQREFEALAISEQQKADLEHLRKNVHPSLVDLISLGPGSDGTNQAISDYAAFTFKEKILLLQEELAQLKRDVERLRLQVVPDATPETPENDLPETHIKAAQT